jgi:glycosyltransferase involved in cell wall biosynthesis
MAPGKAVSVKRIAVDTWSLHKRFLNHGIHVYARELLTTFAQMAPERGLEIRPFRSPGFDSVSDDLPDSPGLKHQPTSFLKFERLWRYGGSAFVASTSGADLLFNPGGTAVALKSLVPTVSTIHDLTPLVMPSSSRRVTFFLKLLLRAAVKGSTALITDSECSKRDLVSIWGVPESRVSVVYLGYNKAIYNDSLPDKQAQQKLLKKFEIGKPYIVHHGAVQPRKNLKRLIQAYRLLLGRRLDLDFDLILAGPLAWLYGEIVTEAQETAGHRGRVVLTGPLSDADLALMIKGAALEVIPSLYEGFCLPMVEAMACGVPTIAANDSCLPEISGSGLRYFHPESIEDMAVCMEQGLTDQELRRNLVQHGKERSAIFDWQRCATQTLDVLERVVRERTG